VACGAATLVRAWERKTARVRRSMASSQRRLICYWDQGARGARGLTAGKTMANNDHQGTKDHRETYEGFMSVTKWGVILIVIALVLMAVFLV
jgi:hypothetical protein